MDGKCNITQEEVRLLSAYLELFLGRFMTFLFVPGGSVFHKRELFTEYFDLHIY